jgi:hypothetical protein
MNHSFFWGIARAYPWRCCECNWIKTSIWVLRSTEQSQNSGRYTTLQVLPRSTRVHRDTAENWVDPPGSPGPCTCGHAFNDYHEAQVFEGRPGCQWPWAALECIFYSSNEGAGLAADGKTVHCLHYQPAWKVAPRTGGYAQFAKLASEPRKADEIATGFRAPE